MAFLMQKRPLNMAATSVFWIVYGLSYLGAMVSLLRAPDLDVALWNTVGLETSFVTYLLFIPVLATKSARRALLIMLISVAILWTFEIQQLVKVYGTLAYSSFGIYVPRNDKNYIGFILSMAGTALFYLAAFWKPSRALRKWQIFAIRLISSLGGIFLFFNLTLVYARSGVLTSFVGIAAILGVMFIQGKRERRFVLLRVAVIIAIIVVSIVFLSPKILATSPAWERYIREILEGSDAFYAREMLIRKGLFLVRQNPVLGVGLGGSIHAVPGYVGFPWAWIHNSYLTDWAEKGILGLLSNVVWILAYLKILRRKFFDLPVLDQIWLLLFIPLFFNMNFLDMSSLNMTMLAILAGIYYEQYQMEHTKLAPFFTKNMGG